MRHFKQIKASVMIITGVMTLFSCTSKKKDNKKEQPNILWITSEDNSAYLGCYGDKNATTPNLDRLASKGVIFNNAFANAPVCAPARNTIITGMYSTSMGTEHMRSNHPMPLFVKGFPIYLRKEGYYCTNNKKEDYNTSNELRVWNDSSPKASYRNRAKGQPFFHIKNLVVSHESCIHDSIPMEKLQHDPKKMVVPPYHPDTKAVRHDWAQFYDKITEMDRQVGEILAELEKDGEADNTIVIYYSDHGGVLPRSKRFLYETGTKVPMIAYFPPKYAHLNPWGVGKHTDRLVSFVDLAPTMLSLCGVKIPNYMQGKAFMGKGALKPKTYVHMYRGRMDEKYDLVRAVRDKRYRYIRNFMPYKISGQHLNYLWKAPSTRSWEREYLAGRCNKVQSAFWEPRPIEELYDVERDPWEVDNLADNPQYQEVLKRMRKVNHEWMIRTHDTGFIPEGELMSYNENCDGYDYVRNIKNKEIITAAEKAMTPNVRNDKLLRMFNASNPSIRYWGLNGMIFNKRDDKKITTKALTLLKDPSFDVKVAAIEALYPLGYEKESMDALIHLFDIDGNQYQFCHLFNTILALNLDTPTLRKKVMGYYQDKSRISDNPKIAYDLRSAAQTLFDQWGMKR
ncbi:sulfatase [Halosquirtibacter xylanolyticus]|uniref:sulfatase family protein n=1 Tax=Halosquirtibacter xylanolyticus TaxID=3374599 RepID=UPI003748F6CE|nr:sulfatase [Prolixibacteraceae bacterium]